MKFSKMYFIRKCAFYIFWISIIWRSSFGLECYTNTDIDDSGPVVVTQIGTIAGKYINVMDKQIPAFLGIPFAKPPLGERRFKISEPVEEWNGTLIAKEKSPACMQYSSREVGWLPPPTFNFSEDCLYLNVWLPPNCCCNRMEKLPVMAFIYGGGYYSGSAMMDIYDGDVLATLGEVIVVTFNYRLNVFGFLNLDSRDAPGNMGLYDQLLALKWIRENIASFGGNPNRVTLFGESAGSFSVSLQMVSPLSRNLFHQGILESGTAILPVTVDNLNSSFSKAIKYSKVLGCSFKNSNLKIMSKDILDCLKAKNNNELAIADNYFSSKFPEFFSPSYGNKCDDCLKYFMESPVNSLLSGEFSKIPILIGNNKDEGTLFMIYNIPRLFRFDQKPLLTVSVAKKALKEFFKSVMLSKIPSSRIFKYYMKNIIGDKSDGPLQAVSMIYGDFLMKCANIALADKAKDVYYYYFSHRSLKDKDDKWVGVPHFAEIPYVFGDVFRNTQNYTTEDRKISEDVIQTFSSFAHKGYPVTKNSEPNWPKYFSSDRRVFEFSSKGNKVIPFPNQKACEEIWKPIYSKI